MQATLLIVDDEPRIYQALRRALHREPLEIVYADCGRSALRILEERRVDVLLADENMPGMTGSELLGHVHRRWPDVVRMMLTGTARLEVVIAAVNQGRIARFFTKPCNEAELIIAIRDALAERQGDGLHGSSPPQGAAGTPIQIKPGPAPAPMALDSLTIPARGRSASRKTPATPQGETVIDLEQETSDVDKTLADLQSQLDKLAE